MIPSAKRLKTEEPKPATSQDRSVSECVLKRSRELQKFLNMHEIIKQMATPDLTFLTPDQMDTLFEMQISVDERSMVIPRLLNFIKGCKEKDDACRRLVACIIMSMDEERGYKDLNKIFRFKLPHAERIKIDHLVNEVDSSPLPSPYKTPPPPPAQAMIEAQSSVVVVSPPRSVPYIKLQGSLVEDFHVIEDDMWQSFSFGKYKTLEDTVVGVLGDTTLRDEVDCRIVALWFQSLIVMHKNGDYSHAIDILSNALELCGEGNCTNRSILEGRIYQRMSQNQLMAGRPRVAMLFFQQAKERLCMVGRGYDRANMHCREAKVLSANEPENKEKIIKAYSDALNALSKEDPYYLASFPSITLSMAAFYLRVSFGSKAVGCLQHLDPSDIQMAEEKLKTINEAEHIHLEMRRFEYSFLRAELCRLQGREREARQMFRELTSTPGSSKVKNILTLAEQRVKALNEQLSDP